MSTALEEVPQHLEDAAEASLAWLNEGRTTPFEITGVIAPQAAESDGAYELGLVLCDGDICIREQVRITPTAGGYQIAQAPQQQAAVPMHLDPPVDIRANWLDHQLGQHAFVVLLFYRGLW